MPKMCTNHLSVLQNNVKRGKVRVRSAKGVRKFITSNVPRKTQKRRRENRNSKTEKNKLGLSWAKLRSRLANLAT